MTKNFAPVQRYVEENGVDELNERHTLSAKCCGNRCGAVAGGVCGGSAWLITQHSTCGVRKPLFTQPRHKMKIDLYRV
jgi:hypothetical protein